MKDRVLIDTSIWIPYLQGSAPEGLERIVDELLAGRDVLVPKIVLAELIQGARSEKDIAAILEFLEAFTVVDGGEQTWLDAGRLSYDMKKRGKTINLADCYIAVLAREHRASILTLDKHFKELHKEAGLDMIDVE